MVEVAQCATDSLGVGINDQCPSMPRGPCFLVVTQRVFGVIQAQFVGNDARQYIVYVYIKVFRRRLYGM